MSFVSVASRNLFFSLLCLLAAPIFSFPYLEKPLINSDDKIVFCAVDDASPKDRARGKTVVVSDGKNPQSAEVVTCFPEKMRLVSSSILEVQNEFGVARIAFSSAPQAGGLSWVSREKSFPFGALGVSAKSVSPDGKWLCFVRKCPDGSMRTVVREISTSIEAVLDDSPFFSFDKPPVIWSPDSKIALYEKNGSVYFFDMKAAFSGISIEEKFRRIGEGSLNSVSFAADGTLFYIEGDFVFKISRSELYTRTLHSPAAGSGIVCARLFHRFDKMADEFFASPDARTIALVENGRLVSFLDVSGERGGGVKAVFDVPVPPVLSVKFGVLWASSGPLFFSCARSEDFSSYETSVFRVDFSAKTARLLEKSGAAHGIFPALSPDGVSVACISCGSIVVKDAASWDTVVACPSFEPCVSLAWNGTAELFVGGVWTIQRWKVKSGGIQTVHLSGACEAFWGGDALYAKVPFGDEGSFRFFSYDFSERRWQGAKEVQSDGLVQNGSFRVFVDEKSSRVCIRNLSGGTTKTIFDFGLHRGENAKSIFVVVDALDSCENLSAVLSALARYGIKATFFLNGEFMRRYPLETRLVALLGHQCANMFFAPIDLTEKSGVVMDEEFVRRGLSRAEDEFFALTGRELSSLWHAPFYKSNPILERAALKAGYGRGDGGKSFCAFLERHGFFSQAHGTSSLVSSISKSVGEGSVVVVSLGGSAQGVRGDVLDALLQSLFERGFSVR
ncbi:MAG: polysaccharide deacetylase family protein [Treponema sp.]|nr:polysaccharide deacetylase family protein [Treponema sp.]